MARSTISSTLPSIEISTPFSSGLVRQKIGFEQLNEGLAQVAELRMQYPEATLKELGMMLSPQVGKSGVNHRLRKLSAMADELREKQGGELL